MIRETSGPTSIRQCTEKTKAARGGEVLPKALNLGAACAVGDLITRQLQEALAKSAREKLDQVPRMMDELHDELKRTNDKDSGLYSSGRKRKMVALEEQVDEVSSVFLLPRLHPKYRGNANPK